MAYMIIYKMQNGITATAFYNTLNDANESFRLIAQNTAELYKRSKEGYKRIK